MLAEVAGDDPATGDYVHYHMDIHGSVRQARNGAGGILAVQDYEPYGGGLLALGAPLAHGYTGPPAEPGDGALQNLPPDV